MMGHSCFSQTVTLAGQVCGIDLAKRSFTVKTRSGDEFVAVAGPTTYYEVLTNLDRMERDRVPELEGRRRDDDPVSYDLEKYVKIDMPIFVRGIYQENGSNQRFEARTVYLLHSVAGRYLFEETHWWLVQISQLADRWLELLFDVKRNYTVNDFSEFYRTNLNITGQPTNDNVQECATLSRLIYGLASAYLLTGAERYFLAAKAAVEYQREAFRSLTHDGRRCIWAFGLRRTAEGEQLIIASENDDDRGAIPLYEQIYALAGLAQYYRISQDWEVLEDIRRTVNAFQAFFWDPTEEALQRLGDNHRAELQDRGFAGTGGYYSHLDHATMRPDSGALGRNRSRKNWNSVGDHVPAYLINLILALDAAPQERSREAIEELRATCRGILDETSDLIIEKFPDPQSDYVNERFHADWTPDHEWGWQQNRAIVGHDLKIAWNLTRCAFFYQMEAKNLRDRSKNNEAEVLERKVESCLSLARRLGDQMAEVGMDKIRGGVFDAVERQPTNDMPTQFTWGATKDFWQQEQGILAYLILHGATPSERQYLELARECTAFWNLFFLDRQRRGIFFRTSESGLPITEGVYGQKGGHSVSGYHAFELNYLAHFYMRMFVEGAQGDRNFCIYFKVSGLRERAVGEQTINVLPDFVPPGRLEIMTVRANGIDVTSQCKPRHANDFRVSLEDLPCDLVTGMTEIQVEFCAIPASPDPN